MTQILPPDIARALQAFVDSLERTFKADLLSMVLYGRAARGDYAPEGSDVEVMIVLKELDTPALQRLAGAVQTARRRFPLEPFILTLEELRRSADVFALRYADIQRHYQVLMGEDLIDMVFVHGEHLRLACEREAKSMVLRLRQLYMLRSGLRPAMRETLLQQVNPMMRLIEHSLELTGKELPAEMEAMLELAQAEIGVSSASLFRLWTLRFASVSIDQTALTKLYESLVSDCVRLAAYLDRLAR